MSDSFDPDLDPEFDARARAAGRAVREPAPPDGLHRVHVAKRRRAAAQVGVGVAVVAVLIGAAVIVLGRRSDDTTQIVDQPDGVETVTTDTVTTDTVTTDTVTTVPGAPPVTSAADGDPATARPTTDQAGDPGPTAPEPTEPIAAPAPTTVPYASAGLFAGPDWTSDRTAAITEPLADGIYWSDEYSSDGAAVTFRLVQRVRGDACIEEFGDAADTECASDSGRITDPSTLVTMSGDGAETSVVSTAAVGAGPGFESFRVPTAEFARLAAGSSPSAGAPAGYTWVPFPVLVVIRDGGVAAAHQMFQS